MDIIIQTCFDYLAEMHLDPVSAVAGGTAWAIARWVLLLLLNLMKPCELSPIAKDILSQLDRTGWRMNENGYLCREAVKISDHCISVVGKDASEHMTRAERRRIRKKAARLAYGLETIARQGEKDKILRALGSEVEGV